MISNPIFSSVSTQLDNFFSVPTLSDSIRYHLINPIHTCLYSPINPARPNAKCTIFESKNYHLQNWYTVDGIFVSFSHLCLPGNKLSLAISNTVCILLIRKTWKPIYINENRFKFQIEKLLILVTGYNPHTKVEKGYRCHFLSIFRIFISQSFVFLCDNISRMQKWNEDVYVYAFLCVFAFQFLSTENCVKSKEEKNYVKWRGAYSMSRSRKKRSRCIESCKYTWDNKRRGRCEY